MQEKEIEKKFRDAVRAEGGKAYKFVSPGNAGVPDRLVILPGGVVGFVELKARGNIPTKLQEHQMSRIRRMGCFACVLDRVEDIPGVISAIRGHASREADQHGI